MENIHINQSNVLDVIEKTMNLCHAYMSIYVLQELVIDKDDYQSKLLNLHTELQHYISALLEYKKKKHTLKSVKKTIDRVSIHIKDTMSEARHDIVTM